MVKQSKTKDEEELDFSSPYKREKINSGKIIRCLACGSAYLENDEEGCPECGLDSEG